MRGFQKGITLGGRTSGIALKVVGGWWWGGGSLNLVSLKSKSLDFTLSLGLTWYWT